MNRQWNSLLWLAIWSTVSCANLPVRAETPNESTASSPIEAGLKILTKGAANYPEHRECFSCHHQTMPLLAMTAARDAGRPLDTELATTQTEFTLKSFRERIKGLTSGNGIGGKGATVGYGLWTLDLMSHPADETTAAMVTFLLKTQGTSGEWRPPSHRPPMEESIVSCTVLAAYGIDRYATGEQRPQADQALTKARSFLASAALKSHEDFVFRLWGLKLLGAGEGEDAAVQIAVIREKILAAQHEDGGWPQLPEMDSDAYATGQTLYVLRQTETPANDPSIIRGTNFLRNTQQKDGSWKVETRAKPVQVFFDNGDPHGKSQFISMAATGWAVTALAELEKPKKD